MTPTQIDAALANLRDDETRCELSDYAVNTLRAYALKMGWNQGDLIVLISEETARIEGGSLDMTGYLRTPRAGSRFLLSRHERRCVFAAIAARKGHR